MSVEESESDYERNKLHWFIACRWKLFYKVNIIFILVSVHLFPSLHNAQAQRSRHMCYFAHIFAY